MKRIVLTFALLLVGAALGLQAQQKRPRYVTTDYQLEIPFAPGSALVDSTDSVVAVRLDRIRKAVSKSYDNPSSVIYGMNVRALAPTKELADERAQNVKTWLRLRYPSPVKLQALQTQGVVGQKDEAILTFSVTVKQEE